MKTIINLNIASLKDAKTLLKIQKECFKPYSIKYGDFDSNPYHMTLHRMEFNLRYSFGHYFKIIDFVTDEIIGGLFIFELDDPNIMKIAQFYLKEEYIHQGIGSIVMDTIMKKYTNVTTWYVDTIFEEDYNVEFYKHKGFEVIDTEEEHEGLTFVTLIKKNN